MNGIGVIHHAKHVTCVNHTTCNVYRKIIASNDLNLDSNQNYLKYEATVLSERRSNNDDDDK